MYFKKKSFFQKKFISVKNFFFNFLFETTVFFQKNVFLNAFEIQKKALLQKNTFQTKKVSF